MCEFTGTRTRSDANPGRCTKTPGYLAYAEITEILARADGVTSFHDGASNTDVILYKGDYVSYMTPTTKDTRRNDWKALNFAGTIDWAVDLQSFTHDDMNLAPDRPKSGEACVLGRERTLNSAQLCAFSCELGFCPDTLCICRERGELNPLPPVKSNQSFVAIDALDVDMNRLCKFACKYGYCPSDVCEPEPVDNDQGIETFEDPRLVNRLNCLIYKDPSYRQYTMNQCYNACKNEVEAAKAEGRTTSYGCVGFFPLDQDLPWDKKWSGTGDVAIPGKCSCDNWFVNTLADTILDAMPAIAQVSDGDSPASGLGIGLTMGDRLAASSSCRP